jgi:F-type H+-transporting ATPase subunit a
MLKRKPFRVFLPLNTPWYLIPFLRVVEMVRIRVRPVTLCFRLLANISAGHILLALVCKLSFGAWLLGVILSLLELVVAVVQSFVFVMLIRVYLQESFSHCLFSLLEHNFEEVKDLRD